MAAPFPADIPFPCFLLLHSPYTTPPWGWVDRSRLYTPSITYGDFHQSTSFSYEFREHPPDIKMKTDMLLYSESSCLVDNHKSRSLPPLRMRSFQGPQTLRHGAGQTWPECCEWAHLLPPQLSAGICASLTPAHSSWPTLLSPSLNTPVMLVHTSFAWLDQWSLVYRALSPVLAFTSRTKKNTSPSKAKQRQTSPPGIAFPLWATVCRSLVLHWTTFKIAFVKDRHSGHFCIFVCQQQWIDCNRNNVHFFVLLTE